MSTMIRRDMSEVFNYTSLPHFMCAIAHARVSRRATSLMCVKNSMLLFCLWHLLSATLEQRR